MSNPDYAAFHGDAARILEFMSTNIVATGLLKNSALAGKPEFLELTKKETAAVQDGKTVGNVWYLKQSVSTSPSTALKSYICDYEKDNTKYVMLGDQANFCFTITMNGCTFGIGRPNSSGDVIVSHSNRAAAGAGQALEQRNITRGGHRNADVTLLESATYRPAPKMTATTFGIRTGGKWKFYFQSYRPNGESWDLFGVIPVTTQSQNG